MINSPSSKPFVSICIPVYNGAKTIGKTINSIINQSYENIEIIIVDNCSTDNTVQIVHNFKDKRIKLICHNEYLKIGEFNWNRCFQYANGEYLALFHADDIYSNDIVKKQIDYFSQYPHVCGIFTLGNIINDYDNFVSSYSLPPGLQGNKPIFFNEIMLKLMEYGVFFITPTAMLPTYLYKKLAPFQFDKFGTASDLDMWLRAADCGPLLIIDEKLINYRFSVGSGVGSFAINYLRTIPDSKFCVLDYYINQNRNYDIIPDIIESKYEFLRLKDIIFRAENHKKIGNYKQMLSVTLEIDIFKLFKIILTHPVFSLRQLYDYIISLHHKKNIIQKIYESTLNNSE